MRRAFAAATFLGILLTPVVGDVIMATIYIVEADDVQAEDAIVFANRAQIEGTIEGDLVVFAGSVSISGTVTGSVTVATQGTVDITGVVEGSVRGVARTVDVSGTVRNDVAITAFTTQVSGTVGRDLLPIVFRLGMDGEVGRDLSGRAVTASLNGVVGRDVDLAVRSLTVGGETAVGGDLLYRADGEAEISPGADVAGVVRRLPTQASFAVRVLLWGVNILSFLAFVLAGFVLIWLFRTSVPLASSNVIRRPVRSFLVGLAALVAIPVAGLLLAVTLIGVPLGLALLFLFVLGLVFGPVPSVLAGGELVTRRRLGLFGAFLVAAVIWRGVIWFIPVVGLVVYLTSLAFGVGGWLTAWWDQRKGNFEPPPLWPRRSSQTRHDGIPREAAETLPEDVSAVDVLEPQPAPKNADREKEEAPPEVDDWGLPQGD